MPTVIWRGSQNLLEAPDSPEWTFGERVTLVRKFGGPHALCLSSAPLRGALGTGTALGMRVAESRVQRGRGSTGQLFIQYETDGQPQQGGQLPPDEAECLIEKLEHAVAKHPRYAALSEETLSYINVLLNTSPDDTRRPAAETNVFGIEQAHLLYLKLRRNETHYLIYAPVYRLVEHSWEPPNDLDSGGYLQAPPNFPIVAPAGNEWLREGDRLSFNGTTWTKEKRWLGAPAWDHDLYSS